MKRREFVTLLAGAAAWPIAAWAQEPGRIYRLGNLHLSPRNAPWNVALFDGVKADQHWNQIKSGAAARCLWA